MKREQRGVMNEEDKIGEGEGERMDERERRGK